MNMKNTYVECLNWTWPEKLLYIKECIGDDVPHKKLCGHGVMNKAEILNGYITAKYLYCDSEGMMSYDDESVDRPIRFDYKKLTLSDLKPRTKVYYEKVEFEPNEIWKAFKEHQEVGYLYVNTSDGFECLFDGVFNLAMAISQGDQLYRKVERPVEWWEDAAEFVRENACNMNAIARNLEDDGLYVEAKMTRDQWCDFARILLEQEGE